MDQRDVYLSELLTAGARAHAAGAVLRMEGFDGDGQAPPFQDLVEDSEARVRCLAEALAVGALELFDEHLRWTRVALAARGLPDGFLEQSLDALRDELEERLPAAAGSRATEVLEGARQALASAPAILPSLVEGEIPNADLARRFLLCLLEGRRADGVELLLTAVDDGLSVTEAHQLLSRVQAEMGRMWLMGETGVAEEHLGTRTVEVALALLRTKTTLAPSNGRSVVVATLGGDLHDVGSRMVCDQFEMAGWKVYFLGASTPTRELVRIARERAVDLIAVSASAAGTVLGAAELVAAVRRDLAGSVPVMIGGRIFSKLPELWRKIGADASATCAAEAPELGARLVDSRESERSRSDAPQ